MKFQGKKIVVTLNGVTEANDGEVWEYIGDAFTVSVNDFHLVIWRAGVAFNSFSRDSVKRVTNQEIFEYI